MSKLPVPGIGHEPGFFQLHLTLESCEVRRGLDDMNSNYSMAISHNVSVGDSILSTTRMQKKKERSGYSVV
jgi:hypothetical protein